MIHTADLCSNHDQFHKFPIIYFILQVYGLVFAQLAIILAFVVAFSLEQFKQAVGGLIWIATIAAIFLGVVLLVIIACR